MKLQALEVLEQLIGEQCPNGGQNGVVINLSDGSQLVLIVRPPADEPESETIH